MAIDPSNVNAYLSEQRRIAAASKKNAPVHGTIVDSHGVVEIDDVDDNKSSVSSATNHHHHAPRGDARARGVGGSSVATFDAHEMQMFKDNVSKWIEIDDTISRLNMAIKQRRTVKKELEGDIMSFMNRHAIEDLNTKDAVLRYSRREVKQPLTAKRIKDRLMEFYPEEQRGMADDLITYVFEQGRGTMEKASLKRMK